MIQSKTAVGRIHELKVERLDHQGAWLEARPQPLLLAQKELNRDLAVGEKLRVFVYCAEDGKPRASLRLPLAEAGDFVVLRVKRILREGVYFDLGGGFELPVASEEIPFRPRPAERTLVRIELDEHDGLCGSCRIGDFLEKPQGLKVGQQVKLMVWRTTDLGVKVIIDGCFEGLVYADELPDARPGQRLTGYVARLREDGKVDLNLNPGGRAGVDIGREKILQALVGKGFLPLHDNSSSEEIRRVLGLSKKQFKRALGALYKEGRVELLQSGIRLKE